MDNGMFKCKNGYSYLELPFYVCWRQRQHILSCIPLSSQSPKAPWKFMALKLSYQRLCPARNRPLKKSLAHKILIQNCNSQQQERVTGLEGQQLQIHQPSSHLHRSINQIQPTFFTKHLVMPPIWSWERHRPRLLPPFRIPRNLTLIKIFRKNLCLLLPQSAITAKSFPSAIPHIPTRWIIYDLNAIYILWSSTLNFPYISCKKIHLVTRRFIFLATVSPRTVKTHISTCELRLTGLFFSN